MAKKGENIYKRKDGRWEARFIRGYETGGKPHYGYVYAYSYHEAKDKLEFAKSELLLRGSSHVGKKRMRLNDFCDEWLFIRQNSVKESTYVAYSSIINKYIRPYIGGFYITALSSALVCEFSRQLTANGLSSKRVRDILCILKSVLKYTEEQEPYLLPRISVVYPKIEKTETRILSHEEQDKIVKALTKKMDTEKFGIMLTLLTGLRIGELCALKWENISLKDGTLQVSQTVQRLKDLSAAKDEAATKIVIGTPKTETSSRIIPLTRYATNLCAMWQAPPDAYVLTGKPDDLCEPNRIRGKFKRILKRCGIEGVHFHTLRHTFATRCVECGVEIKSLSEILGHANPSITLAKYVHSSLELKRKEMEKFEQLWS